ncbi:hypothetical protein RRG08_032635 [Elysia crispata]|uniref:Uncharacterized protein n=1 Tax=Elysia crispata TaxID=231223 RepID=A0AAE0Y063_9GAST|nr:hypothetical protein RRG08_032635 [Elysia crispata]
MKAIKAVDINQRRAGEKKKHRGKKVKKFCGRQFRRVGKDVVKINLTGEIKASQGKFGVGLGRRSPMCLHVHRDTHAGGPRVWTIDQQSKPPEHAKTSSQLIWRCRDMYTTTCTNDVRIYLRVYRETWYTHYCDVSFPSSLPGLTTIRRSREVAAYLEHFYLSVALLGKPRIHTLYSPRTRQDRGIELISVESSPSPETARPEQHHRERNRSGVKARPARER